MSLSVTLTILACCLFLFALRVRLDCALIVALGDEAFENLATPPMYRRLRLNWAYQFIQSTAANWRRLITAVFLPSAAIHDGSLEALRHTQRRSALIVGTSNYKDFRLPALPTVDRDLRTLKRTLTSSDIEPFAVSILSGRSRQNITRALHQTLESAEENDLVLLYFAGHGVHDDRGNVFLSTEDTELDRLSQSSLPLEQIMDQIKRSAGHVVLILDCCHAGSAETQERIDQIDSVVAPLGQRERYGVLASQRPVAEASGKSLFTEALIRGLQGDADLDGDGAVGVRELYDFIQNTITAEADTHSKSIARFSDDIVVTNRKRLVLAEPKTRDLTNR